MRRLYYVVMVLHAWVDQETTLRIPVAPTMEDGSMAFLPVFDSEERAEAAYPGKDRIVIAVNQEEEQ